MLDNEVYHAEPTIKKMLTTSLPDGLINMRSNDQGIDGFNQVPHLTPGNIFLNTRVYCTHECVH